MIVVVTSVWGREKGREREREREEEREGGKEKEREMKRKGGRIKSYITRTIVYYLSVSLRRYPWFHLGPEYHSYGMSGSQHYPVPYQETWNINRCV